MVVTGVGIDSFASLVTGAPTLPRGRAAPGYRVTVVFMPHESSSAREVEATLSPATTTTEIHQRVRELAGQDDRLRQLFEAAATP